MNRISSVSAALIAAGLALTAGPALAQFGSIFREEPPRPPADVPQRTGPNNFPPAVERRGYPQSYPGYPSPSYPAQSYPGQSYPAQSPYPPDRYPPRGYPPERYPPQGYPAQDDPGQDDRPGYPQTFPTREPQRLPPAQQPSNAALPGSSGGRGGIQAQPLPPPPGSSSAPDRAALPQQPGSVQNPPGQGQPVGTPPQQQPTSAELPTNEVVVEPPPEKITNPTAVFAGLDKITGRIISFDVAVGETVQFGALRVTPHACYSRPPTEAPRTDAFVDVDEVTLQGEVKRIFNGWMFASSPGLHAVEHPIYDVWLTNCKGGAQTVAASEDHSAQTEAKPAQPTTPPSTRRTTRRR